MLTYKQLIEANIDNEPVINEAIKRRNKKTLRNTFNLIYNNIKRSSDKDEIARLNSELLLLIMEAILKDIK